MKFYFLVYFLKKVYNKIKKFKGRQDEI